MLADLHLSFLPLTSYGRTPPRPTHTVSNRQAGPPAWRTAANKITETLMPTTHSRFAAGDMRLVATMVTNYRCGHCNAEVTELTTRGNTLDATVDHHRGCPVQAGTLPASADFARAAAIPATLKPAPAP